MAVYPGVISYPIPAYQNLPIEAQFYQPSRFVISAITRGQTTTVTTSVDHDYVVGQNVRLLIPTPFGSFQLNNMQGYVISIPASNQVVIAIDSSFVNSFIASPFTATISAITQAAKAVLTVNQRVFGNSVYISGVGGMTQLNGNVYVIDSQTGTTITINVDSTTFTAYTSGGIATVYPTNGSQAQILAIGDIANGTTNSTGRNNTSTYIPGSFIDISPN